MRTLNMRTAEVESVVALLVEASHLGTGEGGCSSRV